MILIGLGDVHGKWAKVEKIFRHEFYADPTAQAVSVGDLCSYEYPFPVTLPFSPGNHDHPRGIALLHDHPYLRPLTAGTGRYSLNGIRIVGIGGTEQPAGRSDGQPKFFTERDIAALKPFIGSIDVLLTHEAPYHSSTIKHNSKGELVHFGSSLLTEAIEQLKPRFALFGHHHVSLDFTIGATQVIGLPQPHHGYVRIDLATGTYERVVAENPDSRFRYAWEDVEDAAARHYNRVPQALRERAQLLENGNLVAAVQEFQEHRSTHPYSHYYLATAKFRSMVAECRSSPDEIAEIGNEYRAALLLNPRFADAHQLYGELLQLSAAIEEPRERLATLRRAKHHQEIATALGVRSAR